MHPIVVVVNGREHDVSGGTGVPIKHVFHQTLAINAFSHILSFRVHEAIFLLCFERNLTSYPLLIFFINEKALQIIK